MARVIKVESPEIKELVEALRLTVEYVGIDTLPPLEGWSWFDAVKKYDPELATHFVAEREKSEWGKEVADAELSVLGVLQVDVYMNGGVQVKRTMLTDGTIIYHHRDRVHFAAPWKEGMGYFE